MRVGQIRKRDRNETAIVAALRQAGVRVQPMSAPGFADLVCWTPRLGVLLLEVKAPRGRKTRLQNIFQDAGWPVQIVRTVPEALAACGLRVP
jgi:hypothetical protein